MPNQIILNPRGAVAVTVETALNSTQNVTELDSRVDGVGCEVPEHES